MPSLAERWNLEASWSSCHDLPLFQVVSPQRNHLPQDIPPDYSEWLASQLDRCTKQPCQLSSSSLPRYSSLVRPESVSLALSRPILFPREPSELSLCDLWPPRPSEYRLGTLVSIWMKPNVSKQAQAFKSPQRGISLPKNEWVLPRNYIVLYRELRFHPLERRFLVSAGSLPFFAALIAWQCPNLLVSLKRLLASETKVLSASSSGRLPMPYALLAAIYSCVKISSSHLVKSEGGLLHFPPPWYFSSHPPLFKII